MKVTSILALLAAAMLTACGHSEGSAASGATTAPAAPAGPAYCQSVPIGGSFCEAVEVQAPKATLRLAVANTAELREHGLMGVRNVPPHEGMIFVFPDAANAVRQFWMKDTIVPLDMIFVSSSGVVTEIAENVAASKPGDPVSRIARREGTGRYVVELRAGDAESDGIAPGMRLIIPSIASE